jgi:hypothetical protein
MRGLGHCSSGVLTVSSAMETVLLEKCLLEGTDNFLRSNAVIFIYNVFQLPRDPPPSLCILARPAGWGVRIQYYWVCIVNHKQ